MFTQKLSGKALQDAFLLGRLIPPYFGHLAKIWWKLESDQPDLKKEKDFFEKQLTQAAKGLQIQLPEITENLKLKKYDVDSLFKKHAQNWNNEIKERINLIHHPAIGESLSIGFFTAWSDWIFRQFANDKPLSEGMYYESIAIAVLGVRSNVNYCPIPFDVIKPYFAALRNKNATYITLKKPTAIFLEKLFAWFDSFDSPHGVAQELEHDLMLVNPIWKARSTKELGNRVFILMPFSKEWSKPVFDLIRGVSKDLEMECFRADDFFGKDIVEEIWREILRASIIVVDVTEENPNVFYELGLAHAVGKDCVLLSQNAKYIPFDLNRFRHIIYTPTPGGLKLLGTKLKKMIKARKNERQRLVTPIPG
jgi:hypothetical protein